MTEWPATFEFEWKPRPSLLEPLVAPRDFLIAAATQEDADIVGLIHVGLLLRRRLSK